VQSLLAMHLFARNAACTLLITLLGLVSICAQTVVDSLEEAVNRASADQKLDVLLSVSESYIDINPDKTLDYGLQALVQAKKQGKVLQEAHALRIMGMANYNIRQLENALRYFNRALSLYDQLNRRNEQVATLIGLAKVYDYTRNPELALQFLQKANRIADQSGTVQSRIDVLQYLGQVFLKQESYKSALGQFNKVLALVENGSGLSAELRNRIRVQCYNQIGLANKNLGELDKSLQAYRKACSISLEMRDTLSYSTNLREVALSFYLLQDMDSSFAYYTKAYNTSRTIPDSMGMLLSLQGMGDVNFETGSINQAIYFFNQQFAISERIKDVQGVVTALVKISRCHYALGDFPVSTEYLNRALSIAKARNLTSSQADVYRYLSLISETQGRYKDALAFHKLWTEIRDSIYSEETGQKLAKLQILYEITQKERENEILRQNSEIQRLQLSKNQYQRLILVAIAISFLVLLVFLLLLYQAKHKEVIKQREAEKRIVEINRELEKRMILEIKKQEKQQQLLAQKSKLESLGTLAAGIAHEINQPLGGISMGLDNILLKVSERNCSEAYLKEKVNTLFENVERIKKIIDHIRFFSRAQKPVSFEQISINEVIKSALFMVSAQYENHGVTIDVRLDESIGPIVGDKYKFEQVLLNLLSNAKYAVDEKEKNLNDGKYRKRIEIRSWKNSTNVFVSVWDNGIGIPANIIDKIFDPFFTTKGEDKGTGLGLSISYSFIKDILGEVRVDSVEGEYTLFEVAIPKT